MRHWFKRGWVKTKEALTRPEMKRRYGELERAIKVATVEKEEARNTRELAEAVKVLAEAFKDVEEIAVSIGNILFIRAKGRPDYVRGVAGVKLSDKLSTGDQIHILGHTTDLTESVQSIQIEHQEVAAAEAGAEIGLKVSEHVREHDTVFKID